jgi:shikimate dehydrogenase
MRRPLPGLIGAFIRRSTSPALHEAAGGHQVHCRLIDPDGSGLDDAGLPGRPHAVRLIGFDGFSVTHSSKQQVVPLLAALSDEARSIGAVNTVVRDGDRLIGRNSDACGWARGLQRALPRTGIASLVRVGSGGAGSACADAALRLGAQRLAIHDVDAERAGALAIRLNGHHRGARARAVADLACPVRCATGVIHATPTAWPSTPACRSARTRCIRTHGCPRWCTCRRRPRCRRRRGGSAARS